MTSIKWTSRLYNTLDQFYLNRWIERNESINFATQSLI